MYFSSQSRLIVRSLARDETFPRVLFVLSLLALGETEFGAIIDFAEVHGHELLGLDGPRECERAFGVRREPVDCLRGRTCPCCTMGSIDWVTRPVCDGTEFH